MACGNSDNNNLLCVIYFAISSYSCSKGVASTVNPGEDMGEGDSYSRGWDWKLRESVWKSVGRALQEQKLSLPRDPAIPRLGISKGLDVNSTDVDSAVAIAAPLTVAKKMETT